MAGVALETSLSVEEADRMLSQGWRARDTWRYGQSTAGCSIPCGKTAGGAGVTPNSVYAEERYVVVGYEVEDLTDGRRVGEHPVELQPLIGLESDEEQFRKDGLGTDIVELTDEGDTNFRMVNNSGSVSEGPNNMAKGPLQSMAAFEPDQGLEPGDKHRFLLKVPIVESPVVQMGQERPPPEEPFEGGTFVFDFEVPVQAVQVGQNDTVEGVTLTLDRGGKKSGLRPRSPPGDLGPSRAVRGTAHPGAYLRKIASEPGHPGPGPLLVGEGLLQPGRGLSVP